MARPPAHRRCCSPDDRTESRFESNLARFSERIAQDRDAQGAGRVSRAPFAVPEAAAVDANIGPPLTLLPAFSSLDQCAAEDRVGTIEYRVLDTANEQQYFCHHAGRQACHGENGGRAAGALKLGLEARGHRDASPCRGDLLQGILRATSARSGPYGLAA